MFFIQRQMSGIFYELAKLPLIICWDILNYIETNFIMHRIFWKHVFSSLTSKNNRARLMMYFFRHFDSLFNYTFMTHVTVHYMSR